jgi:hypothetical protein
MYCGSSRWEYCGSLPPFNSFSSDSYSDVCDAYVCAVRIHGGDGGGLDGYVCDERGYCGSGECGGSTGETRSGTHGVRNTYVHEDNKGDWMSNTVYGTYISPISSYYGCYV